MGLENFKTYQLALKLHKECQSLNVKGEVRDQLHRASLSIVLNTAEATGRTGKADQKRFYSIALGSLRETQALIDVMNQNRLKPLADEVGALLFTLCRNRSQ